MELTGIDPHILHNRHPGVVGLARYFEYGHLDLDGREVSARCCELASSMIERLPDGPELTAGLRKLLEAKDCFVRASLDIEYAEPNSG